ncbi:MAG: cytochrome c oxidase subunit II [Acidimicrobiales bacterium]
MSDRQPSPADPETPSRTVAGRSVAGRRAAVGGILALGALGLTGCHMVTFGTFTPVTSQEVPAYHLYQGLTITAMVVGALVWGLIFWCVLRYRKSNRSRKLEGLPKQTRYNFPWEAAYTTVPILMVIGIFIYTIIAENSADRVVASPPHTVDVTAFQWGWSFTYPLSNGKVITVLPKANPAPTPHQASTGEEAVHPVVSYPQMVLPEGKVTQINLVSNDVIHGFYVPQFEFSRYALPGVTNKFDFTPTKTGTFSGRCTQYCGLYHTQMKFSVKVVTPAAYQAWIAKHARSATSPHTAVAQGPVS